MADVVPVAGFVGGLGSLRVYIFMDTGSLTVRLGILLNIVFGLNFSHPWWAYGIVRFNSQAAIYTIIT